MNSIAAILCCVVLAWIGHRIFTTLDYGDHKRKSELFDQAHREGYLEAFFRDKKGV